MLIDETRESLEKRAEEARGGEKSQSNDAVRTLDLKSITYTDHDDPFDVLNGADKEGHIYGLSPLAWVACGNDIYVLELLKKGYIRIERDGMCQRLMMRLMLNYLKILPVMLLRSLRLRGLRRKGPRHFSIAVHYLQRRIWLRLLKMWTTMSHSEFSRIYVLLGKHQQVYLLRFCLNLWS